ncbi:hypothetical protein HID58_089959 [Brassica napus]|uniref:Uncharacterized protein n=4 Tax=Brassica TaxID=3705 RepID=A0ABQ7Y0J3_BRANA|nr:hypothetical protein HID58_089959 [Brassica napus]
MKRRRRRHDAQVCQRWRVQQEDGGLLISWRQLQSSDTDVGAVRDAMSMAVSHHAADFADGLQDVNNCHRVTVVGFKLLPERMLFFNGCLEFTVSTKCPYLRHLWRSLWSLSKLQSLFLQSLQHLKLLQWFHLDCVEITEMPYI